LPDTLVGEMVNELNEQESKDIAELKASLEAENKKRLAEIDQQNKELEAELALKNKQLNDLSEQDKAIFRKQQKRDRIDNKEKRRKEHEINSVDATQKLLQEFEKGFTNLGGAYEQERKKQIERLQEKLKGRSTDIADAQKKQKEEADEKQKQAEVEKEKELERIEQLRKKKDVLLKHIKEG